MYKHVFLNKKLYTLLIQILSSLYKEYDWDTRLQFVYNKYSKLDDENEFDIHVLYMLTYSLRGNMLTDDDIVGMCHLYSLLTLLKTFIQQFSKILITIIMCYMLL